MVGACASDQASGAAAGEGYALSPRGGARPGAGRPRKEPSKTTTVYLSDATRAAMAAAMYRGESRSAFIAAAIAREVAARRK